ncbi:MAG TPA: TonB-dependent receptor [Terriglobales bacterium]|nr:TonB-dependent receptor [Terriglobales bacterium]
MRYLSAVFTLLLLSVMAVAQTSRGTVTGTVTDTTGAVIPNATVTLTSKETKLSREAKSTGVGLFRFDAVDLGEYDIKVTMSGFSVANFTNVTVTAARTIDLPVQLKAGAQETVEVSGQGVDTLQTTEQVRLRSIDSRALADLPIQGQNSLNLLLIAPGVATTDAGGSINSGIGSVNGTRPRGNNFMIDGISNNDISVAGPAIVPTNNDALQEVTVQTSNFSAEFGRAGGAVINQVTKSGGNKLHGTIAWVYRSQLFNASDRAERLGAAAGATDVRAKFKENIPAFTVGGPVYIPGVYDGREKTFWFAGGQWDRYSDRGAAVSFTVPTAAGLAVLQSLSAACPNVALYLQSIDGLTAPTQSASSLAQNGVSIAIPANVFAASGSCNGTDRSGQRVQYGTASRAAASTALNDNHVARVDHRFNDRHSISGRWLYTNTFQNNATIAVSRFFDADSTDRSMSALISHSYVHSATLTNELRLNYGRINPQFPLSNAALAGTLPTYTVGTLSGFGAAATFPQGRTANNYQLQNTMTVVRGKHQLRFGFDLLRQIATQTAPANVRGSITYTSSQVVAGQANTGIVEGFANFIDNFSGPTGALNKVYGTPTYHPTQFQQAYFFQDSWRVTPTFTLNLGVRYENFGQPANIFQLPVVSLDAATYGTPNTVNRDNNNFGPTVGFAWSPQASDGFLGSMLGGKTVIRGGFQTSYDSWFNNLFSNMAGGAPNLVSAVPLAPAQNNATPRGIANWSASFAALTPAPLNPLTDTGSQFMKNMRSPYTMRYSFGVQREMPWKMVADVSYVGSQSRKQLINVQLNPRQPNATLTAVNPINNAGNNTGRLIPTIGGRTPRMSAGNANYNSLQIDVRRGFSETAIGGIQFASAYTWSRNMDNVASAEFTTNQAVTSFSQYQNVFLANRNIDYGRSDNDRTHTWQTAIVWDVRGPKNGWKYNAFGGWTLSYIIPIVSGEPFNIFQGRDSDFDGSTADRPDVGNWNAPINTRGRIVATTTCASGYQNPDVGTAVGVGCVTPADVRWIQVAGYHLPGANTIGRNALTTPGSVLVNMTVLKKFKITEGTMLEFRSEIRNLANHENFNYTPFNNVNINSTLKFLDYSDGRPGGVRTTNSRKINMGLKLIF